MRWRVLAAALLGAAVAPPTQAQVDPNSGIDFVTIGSAGNAPWAGAGLPQDRAVGRGAVDYEYRIGRYEVTSAQWVEFYNAVYARPASENLPHIGLPTFWGGIQTTPPPGSSRAFRTIPDTAMLPAGGITWRTAAMYCNWLHNGKSTAREAFLSGAYDVSTFGYGPNGFTDQFARSPGAQYFIPSWDEWIKAAYYDPNKPNPDGTLGNYWIYNNASDLANIPGPPPSLGGPGTANFGWNFSSEFPFDPTGIPLGAYATTSPWGLFDTGGATSEWTEEVFAPDSLARYRVLEGSRWITSTNEFIADRIGVISADFPSVPSFDFGFRIATIVPAPKVGWPLFVVSVWVGQRRRR
jgi:formylglycine-generating enzyme required for sulfatase activity